MARHCATCVHEQRETIEQALLDGTPILRIHRQYGLSESSVRRHRDLHLSAKLARALATRDEIDGDRLVQWVGGLHQKTLVLLEKAERARDWNAARGLIREGRENLELLGRLAGVIDPQPQVVIDARRQLAVLGSLGENELRALAAVAGDVIEGQVVALKPASGAGFREAANGVQTVEGEVTA
jgi:hypothetical protein